MGESAGGLGETWTEKLPDTKGKGIAVGSSQGSKGSECGKNPQYENDFHRV